MMEETERLCMQLIASVGAARSEFIEAMRCAKDGAFERAKEKMKQGEIHYQQGQRVHSELVAMDMRSDIQVTLLLTHAQDQMMSAESFHILCREWIDLYQMLYHQVLQEKANDGNVI